jgi:hypothetical protein
MRHSFKFVGYDIDEERYCYSCKSCGHCVYASFNMSLKLVDAYFGKVKPVTVRRLF